MEWFLFFVKIPIWLFIDARVKKYFYLDHYRNCEAQETGFQSKNLIIY